MVELYVKLIQKGLKTLDSIADPDLREQVRIRLNETDMTPVEEIQVEVPVEEETPV